VKLFLALLFLTSLLFGDVTLKIATYNVENLFDLKKDGREYVEYVPNTSSNWNASTYKKKLQNISKVIKELDADIIALVEIESLQALKDLKYELKRRDLYYNYHTIADRKNTTVKVALLSKKPFVYAKEVAVTSSYKYRNILEVKYKINEEEFYLFVNHWKAKSGPESQRVVSAKALKKRVDEIGSDKNIILLGDFNSDYEESEKFQRVRRLNDTDGKTGINHVLKTLYQKQKAKETTYVKDALYNLWYDAAQNKRYTHIFRGKGEALDNIIISQSLLNEEGMFYKKESIKALRSDYLFKKKRINRWQMSRKKPRKHKGEGYSDHLPLMAEFIVK
jgi:predicted extracellular nuclease